MWIKTSDMLPSEDGEYLVVQNLFGYLVYDVCSYANDLHMVDEYDFPSPDYNHGGFYDFDSEWGYLEKEHVIAWQKIKPYTE